MNLDTDALDQEFPPSEPLDGLNFHSTRDIANKADAWEALISGQATDGGLFVPDLKDIKTFDSEFFDKDAPLYKLSMSQTSALLLRQFLPSHGEKGVSNEALQTMMDKAHNFELPLEKLDESTTIAWLSESRTASFKDFAARAISQLMERETARKHRLQKIL